MAALLTIEQILALAPDQSAAKAGQELATPRKWVSLGCNDQAIWGECSGSAKTPYQTRIALDGPAFKCSCPSRKFPCKHGLGLYLLQASSRSAFTQSDSPPWVSEWLTTRAKRAEKATDSSAEAPATTTPNPEEQAKRATKRQDKVAKGLQELELWLCDLVRQGLGTVQSQPHSYWEHMAARMVDAQASGAARQLREMASIPAAGDGWQELLLERLGRLFLLIERYKRLEKLPEEVQTDIRSLIGWTQSQEELLAGEGLADSWTVLGVRVKREDRLRVQRTWLRGATTSRAALQLQFAHGKEAFETPYVPGMQYQAELVFFPGAYPLRALVKTPGATERTTGAVTGYGSLPDAYRAYATALTRNPWLEQFPLPLDAVTPVLRDGQWLVRDTAGHCLSLAADFQNGWELFSLSGGYPLSLFGEWDGRTLLPLSAWNRERFVPFTLIEE
ncbi:MAG: SWIM zinc finger family protein [Armatimonadota bacterium]